MSKSIYDMASEILQNTEDGNKLAPEHLRLLEAAVNGELNESGEVYFYKLHKMTLDGYVKPFYHDIENLTQDHEGYIYWRGIQVEHYSFSSYDDADKAAQELAERCKALELNGVRVTCTNAIWKWDEIKERLKK